MFLNVCISYVFHKLWNSLCISLHTCAIHRVSYPLGNRFSLVSESFLLNHNEPHLSTISISLRSIFFKQISEKQHNFLAVTLFKIEAKNISNSFWEDYKFSFLVLCTE